MRTGKLNENVEPLPRVDSTQMRPPCSSTMRLAMASPSPVPPFAAGRGAVDLLELLEDPLLLILRDARPGVGDRGDEHAVGRSHPHRDLAGVGELDGVAHQIQQHLRDPPLVAAADRQIGRKIERELEMLLGRQRLDAR